MKTILINPVSALVMKSKKYRRGLAALPPLGLAYLGSALEKSGIETIIIDQYVDMIDNEKIIKIIKDENPDVVGLSCLTPVMNNVSMLVRSIKELSDDISIVLGNIHPTLFTEEVLRAGLADIVVRGEGEVVLPKVVHLRKNFAGLSGIKNVSYINNGEIFHNPQAEILEDIEKLSYPAWHLFDIDKYSKFSLLGLYKRILPVQGSRGCSNKCIYCSQDKIYNKVRYRSVSNIIDEIEHLHEKFHINCIGFNDAYFPFSESQALEFCDAYISRGLHKKVKWLTETRVDKVNFGVLKKMKEAGLCLIMYGFESGNQGVLDNSGKKTTILQAIKAMEYTKKLNIHSLGFFMLGLPGETPRTCRETIQFAKRLDCDIAKFNITVPYPGSKLFDDLKLKAQSLKEPDKFTSWYDWLINDGDIVYRPEGISSNRELVNLQRKAMFEFYMRPKLIMRHLFRQTFTCADLFFGFYILLSGYLRSLANKLKKI